MSADSTIRKYCVGERVLIEAVVEEGNLPDDDRVFVRIAGHSRDGGRGWVFARLIHPMETEPRNSEATND